MESGIALFIVIILSLIVYFIPSTTAYARGHHNTMAITMLNLFLGWTFLGWVVALVWASTAVKGPGRQQTTSINSDNQGY